MERDETRHESFHAEIIIGINQETGKKGELILAHGVFKGISTTSENHKKDKVITQLIVYRPVDAKIRELFAQHAEQTAVDYRSELKRKLVALDPVRGEEIFTRHLNKLSGDDKAKIEEAKVKLQKDGVDEEASPQYQGKLYGKLIELYQEKGERIREKLENPPIETDKALIAQAEEELKTMKKPQFSICKMLLGAFRIQKENNRSESAQTRAAYAAEDILLGRKLHDEKDRLATYFCSAYMMTLAQGSALISGLTDQEIEDYKALAATSKEFGSTKRLRGQIKDKILARINGDDKADALKKIYNDNAFMRVDAHHTLSYFTGQLLDQNSTVREFSMLPTTAQAA